MKKSKQKDSQPPFFTLVYTGTPEYTPTGMIMDWKDFVCFMNADGVYITNGNLLKKIDEDVGKPEGE
jgi:hypothetical protein